MVQDFVHPQQGDPFLDACKQKPTADHLPGAPFFLHLYLSVAPLVHRGVIVPDVVEVVLGRT